MKTTRLVSAVIAALAMLSAVFVFASPANANEGGEPWQYSYKKVETPYEYLYRLIRGGTEVLHIDTEHADENGFWFAYKMEPWANGIRPMRWSYQPYGRWCVRADERMVWNPWMNNHWCEVNTDFEPTPGDPYTESLYDDIQWWITHTETCREETGLPWMTGVGQITKRCQKYLLGSEWHGIMQHDTSSHDCAPWEDQTLNKNGRAKCLTQTYPWTNGPVNGFWTPAPDTCTQMPADSNRVWRDPDLYAPESGDGTCTGEETAPNCDEAPAAIRNTVRACTGVEPDPEAEKFTSTSTATFTANENVEVTRTQTAQAKKVLHKKKFVRKVKRKGRVYRAKHVAKIVRKVKRTATMSGTFDGQATVTADATCVSYVSQEEADECAQVDAEAKAESQAVEEARKDAIASGNQSLNRKAKQAAKALARDAVAAKKASKKQKKKANKHAKKQARKKALRKARR